MLRFLYIYKLKEAFEEYKNVPMDWVVSEIHAQAMLYHILYRQYSNTRMNISTSDKAFPLLTDMSPVRLEYRAIDRSQKNRRLDIAVLNTDNSNIDCDKKREIDKYVEFFIEIKIGWGYHKQQFCSKSVKKDLRLLSMYSEKGYMFYFIGNKYTEMKREYICIYEESLKNYSQELGFNEDNLFIIFRDGVYQYKRGRGLERYLIE